jgi:hypothetical protein
LLELVVIYGGTPQLYATSLLTPIGHESHTRVAAFYRALENKKVDAVKFLINFQEVMQAAERLTVDRVGLYSNIDPFQKNIIARFKHIIDNNHIAYEGNLALLLAAKIGNLSIFNQLLNNHNIWSQFPNTGIIALLMMNRTDDGRNKYLSIESASILIKILDIPSVYDYACTRQHDFQELLAVYTDFKQKASSSISRTTTSSGLTTLDDGSSGRADSPEVRLGFLNTHCFFNGNYDKSNEVAKDNETNPFYQVFL